MDNARKKEVAKILDTLEQITKDLSNIVADEEVQRLNKSAKWLESEKGKAHRDLIMSPMEMAQVALHNALHALRTFPLE